MHGKEDLLALFTLDELTPTFQALLDLYFDTDVQPCAGCELSADYSDGLQYMFASPELYARNGGRFVGIGQATSSGSLYGLLRPTTPRPVDEWPVAVFGDEGGVGVLAASLTDWLRFMTLNAEPYVSRKRHRDPATGERTYTTVFELLENEDDEAREGDGEDGDGHAQYLAWLHTTCGLEPVTSPEQAQAKIIAPAQQHYQAEVDELVGS